MSERENIAMMIKIEQLLLLKQSRGFTFREASDYFDQYQIWEFIDDAYYGFHVQGAQATFEDINNYIQNIAAKPAG